MSDAEYNHTKRHEWTCDQAWRHSNDAYGLNMEFEEFDAIMRLLANPDIMDTPLEILRTPLD